MVIVVAKVSGRMQGIHTVALDVMNELVDLAIRRVLSARAKKVAERAAGDAAIAPLVEQRKRLLVVCCGLAHPSAFKTTERW